MSNNLDRLYATFERSTIPITVADLSLPDEPLVFVNDAFLALVGYERDEVVDRNCRFLQGHLRDQPGLADIREFLKSKDAKEQRALLTNFKKDGHGFRNLVFLSRVPDRDAERELVLGSQFDVTAAHKTLSLAKAVGAHSQQLQRAMVSVDETRLTTAQMKIQASEMAARSLQAITRGINLS
ncbi:MAG: PAS domain-containing protein [Parvularcula sp.]|jgi:PAS domain S-box-containing protein|nr:PAS domain-containing protein [Parvularcula sp.]